MTQFRILKPTDKIFIESALAKNTEPWVWSEEIEKGYITFEDLVKCIQNQIITPAIIIGPGSNNYNRDYDGV